MLDWLRLFRAHTAPATVYSVLVPYIVGGGRDWALALYLYFTGTLLHWASFGHNSVMDYLLGFDRSDPSKRHHPLPAGRISPERALWIVNLLLAYTALLLAYPALLLGDPRPLLWLVLFMVWGYAYNTGLDHLSRHSWLPITLAYSFLPLYGYTLAGAKYGVVGGALLALWGSLTVLYQIALEGNLKDLWNPADRAPGLLRSRCRMTGDGRVYCDSSVDLLLLARLWSHILAYSIGVLVWPTRLWVTAGLLLLVLALLVTERLHGAMTRGATRMEALRYMGLQEVLAFYLLLAMVLPAWPAAVALLMLYGYAWFAAMNRWLWGSDRPLV